MRSGLGALGAGAAPSDPTPGAAAGQTCTRGQEGWPETHCSGKPEPQLPREPRALSKRVLSWALEMGCPWPLRGQFPALLAALSWHPVAPAGTGSAQAPGARKRGASDTWPAPGLKVPAGKANRFPRGWGGRGHGPSGSTLSSTRVVNRSRRVGGAAGTLSHSLAPRRAEEAEGQGAGTGKSEGPERGRR